MITLLRKSRPEIHNCLMMYWRARKMLSRKMQLWRAFFAYSDSRILGRPGCDQIQKNATSFQMLHHIHCNDIRKRAYEVLLTFIFLSGHAGYFNADGYKTQTWPIIFFELARQRPPDRAAIVNSAEHEHIAHKSTKTRRGFCLSFSINVWVSIPIGSFEKKTGHGFLPCPCSRLKLLNSWEC